MTSPQVRTSRRRFLAAWLGCWAFAAVSAAEQRPLVLMIQPSLSEEEARRAYQPLADYLAQTTGVPVTLALQPNSFAHWEAVRRNVSYDLVLDEAHFTDYRVQKFGFHILAKIPGTISYSLVVLHNRRVRDPLELAGRRVASFGPPSIGATRLSAMFPNPSRRPAIIEIASAAEGLELVLRGKVNAAILPTSSVSEPVSRGRLDIVITSEPTPQMALSISPRVNGALRESIQRALLRAGQFGNGERALVKADFAHFEAANPAIYANQSRILKDAWGY